MNMIQLSIFIITVLKANIFLKPIFFLKPLSNPQLTRGEGRVKGEPGEIGRTCQSDRHLGGPSGGEFFEKLNLMLVAVVLHPAGKQ